MIQQKLRTDDLTIPQGADFKVQWPIRDADGDALPSMTGWTARAQAREGVGSAATTAEWTSENGGILLADSSLTLVISNAESSRWEWGSAQYDVELVSPTGEVTRITQGWLTLDAEVTR